MNICKRVAVFSSCFAHLVLYPDAGDIKKRAVIAYLS